MLRIVSIPVVATLLCGSGLLLMTSDHSTVVSAQEPEDETRPEEGNDRPAAEVLERRLNRIEELIEQAEKDGNEERLRELREEGERLLDQLEQLERQREEPEEEEGDEEREELKERARDLEFHRLELEIERLHQELQAVGQESALRLARISENRLASASYAISQAIAEVEAEEAIDFLVELKEETDDASIQRLLSHHLARLYRHADRPDAARREARSLILGK